MPRPRLDPIREDRIDNEAIVGADESTQEAIGDWSYWVGRGHIL